MILYGVIFTGLAFNQHAALRTHKSDLGQMDQAIWNTSRGRFVEEIKEDFLSTRLTDHVEPIFLPLSAVFWLWDDVRAILLLQVLAVALGAIPLFALARGKLGGALALGFVAAYLLNPSLQSAVLTEFHAIPLAVPFLLWAPKTARTDDQTAFGERNCAHGGLGTFPARDALPLALAHAGRLDKFGA